MPDTVFCDPILEGRVAVITGGGTGLGRAFALRFSQLGAKLVLASRSADHLNPTRDEIVSSGGAAIAVPTDVRLPDQVEALMKRANEAYGSIDILINNAAGNFLCRAEKLSYNGWRTVIDIVLNGTFYCCRAAYPFMERQRYGRILNILATYASGSGPGTIHSAAAKAGVQAMTRTLAVEWARYGIRANGLSPGSFPTEGASSRLWLGSREEAEERVSRSVPVGRHGRHEELANLAAYLCSSYGDYINGATVTIDGGAMWNHSSFEWDKL
jgi:NAD(P)-dependent dehydrogenase (short-subunit alcohol dehydrogenase family)